MVDEGLVTKTLIEQMKRQRKLEYPNEDLEDAFDLENISF